MKHDKIDEISDIQHDHKLFKVNITVDYDKDFYIIAKDNEDAEDVAKYIANYDEDFSDYISTYASTIINPKDLSKKIVVYDSNGEELDSDIRDSLLNIPSIEKNKNQLKIFPD